MVLHLSQDDLGFVIVVALVAVVVAVCTYRRRSEWKERAEARDFQRRYGK